MSIQKDLYDPASTIEGLFAAALGFNWSLDQSSISGNGRAFSPIDYQMLRTWFSHPAGYDFKSSWSDSSRGDVEKPSMVLTAPVSATTNTPVILDATASTDNTGIVEFLWDTDFNVFFDPDTTTATGTLEHVFTDADSSDKTVMVVGKDANNNQSYAEKNINIIASPTAPIFDGYNVHSNNVGSGLNINTDFSNPENVTSPLTYLLSKTNFPDLVINPNGGVIESTFILPDSMAGKAYTATVAADNGSETTSTTVDWIVNRYRHVMDIFYLKNGETQTEQLNGTDRVTDYVKNAVTSEGFFAYSILSTPVELQEAAQRFTQRPDWVEKDMDNYNFTTQTKWSAISATMDSVFQNIAPYELRGIGFTLTGN